ncbi:porin family protein [uncultured Tenacibaculum sp.]|uniref:porin family protein n=1 Tax=uncultured Tenacibaculum sp. TaxID=174713 RepID=UPI0026181F4D|nr:porin family protein [uncultured Tenacibaculum sp.]
MLKRLFCLVFIITCNILFSQADSLKLGDKYLEDQLYLGVSYDIMLNQPKGTSSTGFSYSLSFGYIRDIPLNRKGNFAIGVGAGYGFNSFNHGIQVLDDSTIQLAVDISSNKLVLHNLEFPIQFRWRTSDAITYSFWRIYSGVKMTYNLNNSFNYVENGNSFEFANIPIYNNFQTGLELSAGYGTFNFYMYYGLTPVYKNVVINNTSVNSNIIKFGLIFYLL